MGELPRKPQLSWVGKFRVAFRGIYFGSVGQSSFMVHAAAMIAAVTLAIILQIDLTGWGLITLSIGMVISTELLNSAIETLFRGLPADAQEKNWPALDIAAGAVLVASITAVCIGGIVFVPRLLSFF